MQKRFVAIREAVPGPAWLARFVAGRREAEAWYCGSGRGEPPTVRECAKALCTYMPELVVPYERACALVGDDESAHQILSQWRPPPLPCGCTQAIWLGDEGPALLRNYDYPIETVSDYFESTSWFGREVISKGQRPWGGCTDGMNADGLVASLTFGGSPAQGLGFAVILILRYVLETCTRVPEAVGVLCRIPVALSHNVTLLDRSGDHATVHLCPGRAPEVSRVLACANHQEPIPSADSAGPASHSIQRQLTALRALEDSIATLPSVVAVFLTAPLYSRAARSPTVYSAVYRPADLQVGYLWPGRVMTQRIGGFEPVEYVHDYGGLSG